MKEKLFSLILLSMMGSVHAAELIKLTKQQGIPTDSSLLKQSMTAQLKEIKKSTEHTRFQQVIDGIPVFGHHVMYHHNAHHGYYSGHWIHLLPKEKTALFKSPIYLNANDAILIAKENFQTTKQVQDGIHAKYRHEQAKLYYYFDDAHQLKKVYLVSFFAENEQGQNPARPYYLVDANTKEIIQYWDGLTTNQIGTGPGGNEKIGRYEYGKDYPNLDISVKEDGKTCQMTNDHVETIHLHHEIMGGSVYDYLCSLQNSDDETNGAYSPLNDAHYFGNIIFDMYQNKYNITPLSFKLKMRVHYGNNYENAFWDGSSMTFGDGADNFYPLVALDVAAHEVSHGLTEQNSGLEYWGQSGGLNESFSDMAGKAAEFYMHKENKWSLGADITKGQLPIRYMDNPSRDGNSIGDVRDFEPSLDPHFSSGVFNRLFYTLATTEGWNTEKAFEVFLKANLYYWEPESTFFEAAEGVLQATRDLNYKSEDVLNAAQTVGISCVDVNLSYQCQQSPED